MASKQFYLMGLALLPLTASLVVLMAGGVGQGVWLMHGLSMALAAALALSGPLLRRVASQQGLAVAIMVLTLLGLAVPLAGSADGPERWLLLGPVRLYLAPLLLPAFLAACAVFARAGDRQETAARVALVGAGLALAAQPDASQVLALLAGAAVLCTRFRSGPWRTGGTLLGLALLTLWAFLRPDPLQPVPHVEGVFALALSQSLPAGLLVIGCALAWLAGLCRQAVKGPGPFWLAGVAAYYGVLYACSVAGLTPAPLIGFGAGPVLGFGLLTAVAGALEVEKQNEGKS